MTEPAIRLTGLRAVIDPEAAARKELRARVEAGVLRISREGLRGLIPPDKPAAIEGIHNGRIQVRATVFGVSAVADFLPEATPTGTLLLRPTALRAGFIPLPADAILGVVLPLAPKLPGIRVVHDRMLEIDFQELARRIHVELPPLQRVAVDPAGVDLQFG